jgi:hypothetical protein
MALEHRCVSIGDPSAYALIRIATCAFTRARARIGGTAAHNGRACVGDRPSAVRRGARQAGGGAYVGQRRDSRSVPRADVRVEGRRPPEHLRAETATLGGGVKCSHALSRMRACPRTCTHAHLVLARVGDTRVRRSAYRAGRVHTLVKYRPIPVCRSMAVRRGNRTRTHEAQRRTISPAHTGTSACMGEAPTHTPAHALHRSRIYRCIDIYIPDAWEPSEVHMRTTHTNTRAAAARARTRARVCSGGYGHGRSAHTQRDIDIYTQLYNTFRQNVDRLS